MSKKKSMYYNHKGEPITLDEYVKIVEEDSNAMRVALTKVGEYQVSTVWLGIDHGMWDSDGPPIIFETMVFDAAGEDRYMDRYATKEAAVAGHNKACVLFRDYVCPRCKGLIPNDSQPGEYPGALSRWTRGDKPDAYRIQICAQCGTEEAMEEAAGRLTFIEDWPITRP